MMLFIGSDHKGFDLKEQLKKMLTDNGYQPQDLGNKTLDANDDYVDFAKAVAESVAASGGEARGVVICGSGAGVDITANKIDGVRSVLGVSTDQVFDARQDDDVNVLALGSNFTDANTANDMIKIFLSTPFLGEERHKRRLGKIKDIESAQ